MNFEHIKMKNRGVHHSFSGDTYARLGIMPAKKKNPAKLSLRKVPPFGLAVVVGRIAKPSLPAVMLADDGIMQAAKV